MVVNPSIPVHIKLFLVDCHTRVSVSVFCNHDELTSMLSPPRKYIFPTCVLRRTNGLFCADRSLLNPTCHTCTEAPSNAAFFWIYLVT